MPTGRKLAAARQGANAGPGGDGDGVINDDEILRFGAAPSVPPALRRDPLLLPTAQRESEVWRRHVRRARLDPVASGDPARTNEIRPRAHLHLVAAGGGDPPWRPGGWAI